MSDRSIETKKVIDGLNKLFTQLDFVIQRKTTITSDGHIHSVVASLNRTRIEVTYRESRDSGFHMESINAMEDWDDWLRMKFPPAMEEEGYFNRLTSVDSAVTEFLFNCGILKIKE